MALTNRIKKSVETWESLTLSKSNMMDNTSMMIRGFDNRSDTSNVIDDMSFSTSLSESINNNDNNNIALNSSIGSGGGGNSMNQRQTRINTNSNKMSKTAKRHQKRLTVSGVYSGNR